jgi:enoyl-CoA hydratase/carnithine racemase
MLLRFTFSSVKTLLADKTAVLTLANPKKRNVLDLSTIKELAHKLEEAERTASVVRLQAEGSVFSAGHDLKEVSTDTSCFKAMGSLCQQIRKLKVPVLAVVDGLATAAGCQLVLSCQHSVITK